MRVRASRYAASQRIGVPSLSRAGRNRRRHDHSERLGWIKPSRVGRWRRVLVDVRWVREAASTAAGAAYRMEVRCSASSCGWSHDHILNSLRGFYGEGALPGTTSQRFFANDRESGGPSWSEEAVEYFERRGEFNGRAKCKQSDPCRKTRRRCRNQVYPKRYPCFAGVACDESPVDGFRQTGARRDGLDVHRDLEQGKLGHVPDQR